ncbi:hypothetical protein HHI36_009920 [Cryptolaemus montrouzieri]|uniref:Uncharacterized protein n=1 Tax=Cryptolaemus montrouzieri TaxID=559131 RepID=A0ABD2MH89_9CUCU
MPGEIYSVPADASLIVKCLFRSLRVLSFGLVCAAGGTREHREHEYIELLTYDPNVHCSKFESNVYTTNRCYCYDADGVRNLKYEHLKNDEFWTQENTTQEVHRSERLNRKDRPTRGGGVAVADHISTRILDPVTVRDNINTGDMWNQFGWRLIFEHITY